MRILSSGISSTSLLIFFCLYFMGIFTPAPLISADYLEVTAPGNQKVRLILPEPVPFEGGVKSVSADEIRAVVESDIALTGMFEIVKKKEPVKVKGVPIEDADMNYLQSLGADLVLLTGYRIDAKSLLVESRIIDAVKKQEINARRFTGSLSDLRHISHTVSDEALRVLTGKRGCFSNRIGFVSTMTGNKEIYLGDYDGHNLMRVTKNGSINIFPEFSPDGRDLIYTSYKKGNPQLFRKHLATGDEKQLTRRGGTNIGGTWSPDGSEIALSMSSDGDADIYIMNADGTEPRKTVSFDAIEISPSFSPDNKKLAFVSDRFGSPQIFIAAKDGSGVRRLTSAGRYNVSPKWSPDGNKIIYSRQVGPVFQIFIINPDGTGDSQLTFDGSNEHPRWSPDGRFILFSLSRGTSQGIYLMRSDGSGQSPVITGRGKSMHPVWSR